MGDLRNNPLRRGELIEHIRRREGLIRHLYADGVEVARDDAQLSGLKGSGGGLNFGAGSTLASGTFFSGLIDDVRIYNRAVSP